MDLFAGGGAVCYLGGGFFDFSEGDLASGFGGLQFGDDLGAGGGVGIDLAVYALEGDVVRFEVGRSGIGAGAGEGSGDQQEGSEGRSEEHTSELQSLMRISYAVFCLQKKKQ